MGFSPVTWESLGGWPICAFFRKLTVSQSESLLRFAFIADEQAYNVGGLASTLGGLRASLAGVICPVFSLPPPRALPWEEHLLPSAFALLRVSRLFSRKTSTQYIPASPQGNTGTLGLCPQLPEITRSTCDMSSRMNWKENPGAKGGPSMAV